MKREILSSLSYGIYALGVTNGKCASACIVNTVTQVTNQPDRILVSVSHDNYSCQCIKEKGIFTVSVLSEDTSGAVIGALGFASGKNGDKLANIRYKMLREGVPVIQENICCWFLCQVENQMETDTHTIFFARVLAGSEKTERVPMTYDYYRRAIKGTIPKNSPVYFPARPDDKEENDQSFTCRICKFVYDDPIIPFEELPDDWGCPICGSPKSAFVRNL